MARHSIHIPFHMCHGRLKAFAPVSSKGLPKMETGISSSTQIVEISSKAGSRLLGWQLDLDCFKDFFSCLARNFCSCCSCLILCASHLYRVKSLFVFFFFFSLNVQSRLTFSAASLLSQVCCGVSGSWRRQ